MYTNISGQLGVYKQLELIANNLANINTTGYKAERPLFEKVLSNKDVVLATSLRKDIQEPNSFKTEAYTQLRGSYADFSAGGIEVTNRPLDVAIEGDGFFVVQTPEGERYTRSGNFTLDSTGRLVTQQGYSVQGSGGEIMVSGANVTVGRDGEIKSDKGSLGRLRVVSLNPGDVVRDPSQLFALKDGASASEVTDPVVQGGAIEASNVNAVRELADMIMASRLFEGLKAAQEQASKMNEARNRQVGTIQG